MLCCDSWNPDQQNKNGNGTSIPCGFIRDIIAWEIICPHLSEESTDKIRQYKQEYEFWESLADTKLKPESANLGKVEELKEKLNSLRNLCLLVLLLVNVMWIVFLYTLVFPQFTKYNLPDRTFCLLFLGIFSLVILKRFAAMTFHQIETLVHLLAHTELRHKKPEANYWFQPFDVDTISCAYVCFIEFLCDLSEHVYFFYLLNLFYSITALQCPALKVYSNMCCSLRIT